MTFKEQFLKLKYEKVIRDMYQNQKTPPSANSYGQSLRDVVLNMPYGSDRQNLMKEWFKQLNRNGTGYVVLPINRRWMWNLKDPDLAALLKSGYLILGRDNYGRSRTYDNHKQKRSGAFCSYLKLNKEFKQCLY